MNPFDFQLEGVRQIERFGGRVLLADAMGLGKTLQALLWLKSRPDALPAVVVCPAGVKYYWQHEAAVGVGIAAVVLEGRRPSRNGTDRKIVIINYDILTDWVDRLRAAKPRTIIIDECFPWNTLIQTNYGLLPIGFIVDFQLPVYVQCYDFQNNAIVFSPILHYNRKKRTDSIVRITHRSGFLDCTSNHKVWVEGKGYVKAKKMRNGDHLRMVRENCSSTKKRKNYTKVLRSFLCSKIQQQTSISHRGEEKIKKKAMVELRMVREAIRGDTLQNKRASTAEILQLFLCKQVGEKSSFLDRIHEIPGTNFKDSRSEQSSIQNRKRKTTQEKTIRQDAEKKSYEPAGSCGKNGSYKNCERNSETMEGRAWWQRPTHPSAIKTLEIFGAGLGIRNGDNNGGKPKNGIHLPLQLQSRYRKQETEDSHRSGRSQPPSKKNSNLRSKKAKSTHFVRVESVQIYEQRNRQERGVGNGNCSDVYNIEVAEHHNYFADGILVKNCQYTSNHKTLRTRAVKSLCRGVPHVLALSGTPLLNRPIELFPTLQILRPNVFQSRWNFAHAFCNPKLTPWGWDFKGASNTQKLNSLLVEHLMIRRLKPDVLKDLPPKVRQVVPVPIKRPDEYRRAADDFVAWLRRHDPAKAERASRAAAMVRMGYLLRLSARLKLKHVVGWINRFLADGDEKLVVFAVHRKMIEALKRRCNAGSVVIVGGVKGKKRKMLVDQFQNDDKVRLLIGNIRAAGVGITLTAASTAVFTELAWQPGAMVQAEDRIHRIGTKGTAFIWYLVAHETIEERLCELLQRKQRVLSTVLDGGSVDGDLDVFDSLLKEMKKEE